MKTAIEVYVSVFIICICALLCACVITANLNVASARDAYATYVSELQDSNFADNVIESCKNDALNRGYTIDITVYEDEIGNRSGSVVLKYDYNIALLGFSAPRYIRGYAS